MASGGEYETIRGLANKLAEHAARIAGVLAMVEDPGAQQITVAQLEAGIELAGHYAREALRLHAAAADSPDLLLARRLLTWLGTWQGPISLRDVYRNGPRAIRDAATAGRIMSILQEHGWIGSTLMEWRSTASGIGWSGMSPAIERAAVSPLVATLGRGGRPPQQRRLPGIFDQTPAFVAAVAVSPPLQVPDPQKTENGGNQPFSVLERTRSGDNGDSGDNG